MIEMIDSDGDQLSFPAVVYRFQSREAELNRSYLLMDRGVLQAQE